ncbi:MAG: hypothetical protein A3C22_00410 [Candidatus Levybacteria bacterium RIFCSPHIGHO2_02_FULL_37_10]|nr:MAG: hypothetical protein A3C22_00410 [Candidatus Levybacteria bacterium RIFCSPHIGHO2_02_FULL_37_10]
MRIDGKQIADGILNNLKQDIQTLRNKGIVPKLAIILVGDDPASVMYVRRKEIEAKEIGIKTIIKHFSSDISQNKLITTIQQFNNDGNVHGIIVQQPLPKQINTSLIINAVSADKDIDGFSLSSKFEMPIALAVSKILEKVYIYTPRVEPQFINWLNNKKIAVIGKGETGGKPIINSLRKMGINPIVVDSKTKNPTRLTKTADIIISAVGKPRAVKPNMLKKGVILIGIGISRDKSAKLMGDYDQNRIENIASFYTPTPGGVGPVNIVMLLKNLIIAAKNLN